jgi:dolichol-phosphate mannosyltransferase
MENIELSIIIPAYLEEENLKIILPRIHDILKSSEIKYEILVIDTIKAMDDTAAVCEDNSASHISRQGGNNYGDAIRTGIGEAQGQYLIFMDADGSHSPEFIRKLYDNRDSFDVVVASRYIEGGNTNNNRMLIFMSLIVNKMYSCILNIKCKDISNSFKLYKTADIKGLRLKCSNFDIVEEIIFKLKKQKDNLRIKELPFVFEKRMFGATKRNLVLFIFSYLVTIIKLRFGK